MTGQRPEASQLRDLAVDLARRAGRLLTGCRPDDLDPATKSSPTDLVTVMDRAAERLVLDGLRAARPTDGVLAEESGARDGTSGVRWLLDPLDGTVNYFYGQPAFGVSLAAEVDGTVLAGAVFSALHGGVYDAVLGGGARFEGRIVRCRRPERLSLALVGTGFSYSAEHRRGQGRVIAGMLPHVRDIRRVGAAALDLCDVGSGRLDAFYELGLQPWDCAAGLLVAAESGAVTGRLDSADGPVVVAAAPTVFDELIDRLQRLYVPAQ